MCCTNPLGRGKACLWFQWMPGEGPAACSAGSPANVGKRPWSFGLHRSKSDEFFFFAVIVQDFHHLLLNFV